MWPLLLLALGGGGYYFYKKQSAASTPTQSPYHAAVLSIPAAGAPTTPQNTAVYQSSNGPSSGIQQNPSPSSVSQNPPVVHAPIDFMPVMHTNIMAPVATYKLPNPDGSGTPAPAPAPMPQGVTNAHGEFITWTPFDVGSITHDPSSGNWLSSNQPDTTSLVVNTPQGTINLPRTMIYNIDTAEIRI